MIIYNFMFCDVLEPKKRWETPQYKLLCYHKQETIYSNDKYFPAKFSKNDINDGKSCDHHILETVTRKVM